MEQHQIPITPENAEYIVGELDRKMDMLFDGAFPQDYFFLAGGGAVLLYRPMDENRIRYQSKDLDFIWIQNWQYDNFFVESLKKSSEKFILRDGLMEPYPSDETFISLDLFTAIEGNDTNRYLIEFMASRGFIEKDSEYSQLDFRKDILEYFTNYSYDQFKYIKVCTPFVTWYTRLVTLRDEYGYLYTGSSIRDSDYFQKNMLEIEPAIKKNIITVQEIEEKIGYLVHKYFQNSPIVINDFNEFIGILRNKYGE